MILAAATWMLVQVWWSAETDHVKVTIHPTYADCQRARDGFASYSKCVEQLPFEVTTSKPRN